MRILISYRFRFRLDFSFLWIILGNLKALPFLKDLANKFSEIIEFTLQKLHIGPKLPIWLNFILFI